MSLSERLRKKQIKVERVTVDGDAYVVTGKSKLDRSKIYAKARRKDGTVDTDKLETELLVECVTDEEGTVATAEDWNTTPSHVTGPLVTAVIGVCGMDRDDLKREDPKGSSSTES
jgi:preprotein translocase subunit SecD